MSRTSAPLLLFLGLAACAHTPSQPFFDLPQPRRLAGPALAPPASGGTAPKAYEIHFELRGPALPSPASPPELLQLPMLCAPVERVATLVVRNQWAYVSGLDTLFVRHACIADPEIGMLEDGIELAVATTAGPDRGDVLMAFRLRTSDSPRPLPERSITVRDGASPATIQLPRSEVREVLGVLSQPLGTPGFVAHLPGADGASPLALFATVYAVELDPSPDVRVFLGADAEIGAEPGDVELVELLGRARSAPPTVGTLRMSVVCGGRDSNLTPLEGASLGIRSRLAAGVRAAARAETSYVAGGRDQVFHTGTDWAHSWRPEIEIQRDGLEARVLDGNLLLVTFTEPARWSEEPAGPKSGPFEVQRPDSDELHATLAVRAGEQLVSLGRSRDGRALSVLVRYEPD